MYLHNGVFFTHPSNQYEHFKQNLKAEEIVASFAKQGLCHGFKKIWRKASKNIFSEEQNGTVEETVQKSRFFIIFVLNDQAEYLVSIKKCTIKDFAQLASPSNGGWERDGYL